MKQNLPREEELARLRAVQDAVRTTARNHKWLGDAIRAAFVGYQELGERFRREKSALEDRRRGLARKLLAKGRLSDPKCKGNRPCLFVRVNGLCPVELSDRLSEYQRSDGSLEGDAIPDKLEREGAAAAIAALDRDAVYQARDLPDDKGEAMAEEYRAAVAARTHVPFQWTITVSRPDDWQTPPDPHSLEQADLVRFHEASYLTIAMHKLGGLADAGALRPIVPEPENSGDRVRDAKASVVWLSRLPISNKACYPKRPALSVRAMHPDIAEQLWDDVLAWAKDQAKSRGELLVVSRWGTSRDPHEVLPGQFKAVELSAEQPAETASGQIGSRAGVESSSPAHEHTNRESNQDSDDYRPATWFPKGMAARLRKAASKNRKSKRVRTRKIDGVVCYLVADVRRWWPSDIPNDA